MFMEMKKQPVQLADAFFDNVQAMMSQNKIHEVITAL